MAQSTQKEDMCVSTLVPSPPPSTSDHEQHDISPRRGTRRRRHHHTRTNSSPCSFSSSTARPPPASAATSFASDAKAEEAPPVVLSPDIAQEEEPISSIEPAADGQDAHSDLDTIIGLVKASWQGRLPHHIHEWQVFHISRPQYKELCRLLEAQDPQLLHYFTKQLRHDFNPARAILVLRLMATAYHECVQDEIFFCLRQRVATLETDKTSPVLRLLASDIMSRGHAKVSLGTTEGMGWKSPDCQLGFLSTKADDKRPYHSDGLNTPFIIEVGYSQSAGDLEDLAREYYEDSDGYGNIKTVLTIKLKYTPPQVRQSSKIDTTASFCLYRGPERVHLNVEFCDALGKPSAGTSLQLSLADFVPDAVLAQLSHDDRQQVEQYTINLTPEQLCKIVKGAARQQEVEDRFIQQKSRAKSGAGSGPEPSKKRARIQWDKVYTSPSPEEADGKSSDEADESSRSKRRRVAGHQTERPYRSHGSTHGLPERTMQTRSMSRGRGDEE